MFLLTVTSLSISGRWLLLPKASVIFCFSDWKCQDSFSFMSLWKLKRSFHLSWAEAAQPRSSQQQRPCQCPDVQKHQGELQQGIHTSTCGNETFLDEKRQALLVLEQGKSGHPHLFTPSIGAVVQAMPGLPSPLCPKNNEIYLALVPSPWWSSVFWGQSISCEHCTWTVREAITEGGSGETALDPAAPTSQPGLAVFGAVPSSCKLTVSYTQEFSATSPSACFSGRALSLQMKE